MFMLLITRLFHGGGRLCPLTNRILRHCVNVGMKMAHILHSGIYLALKSQGRKHEPIIILLFISKVGHQNIK